jgi:hypothetical protein
VVIAPATGSPHRSHQGGRIHLTCARQSGQTNPAAGPARRWRQTWQISGKKKLNPALIQGPSHGTRETHQRGGTAGVTSR